MTTCASIAHYDDAEAIQSFYAPPGDVRSLLLPLPQQFDLLTISCMKQPQARKPTLRRKTQPSSDKEEAPSTASSEVRLAAARPNTIRVLDTSLRYPSTDDNSLHPSRPRPLLQRFNSPLKNIAQPLTPTENAPSPASHTPPATTSKRLRQRWHFGIRSRSEPMEVMLEIYRTLKTLKMEWKAKPREGAEEGEGEEGRDRERERDRERGDESEKQRRRREEEERIKKAQELYFVETRCRMDDVMVRSLSPSCPVPHVFDITADSISDSSSGSNGSTTVSNRRPKLPRRLPQPRLSTNATNSRFRRILASLFLPTDTDVGSEFDQSLADGDASMRSRDDVPLVFFRPSNTEHSRRTTVTET